MAAINVYISIDIGSDVTKSAYAYKVGGKYFQNRLQINGTDFLSMAYYDPQKNCWKFGRDVYNAAKDNFRYLVMIRELLDLFHTKDVNHYYDKGHLFRNFYFPPVQEEGSFEQMIKAQMCFETSADTPQTVCKMFLKTYCDKIKAQANKVLKNKAELAGYTLDYKYVLVYPSNSSLDYIKELMSLVRFATGTNEDPKLISASKAVGAAAREYDLIDVKQPKNVLIFNVGGNETSVVRAKIDENNIYTYRLKADVAYSSSNGMSANEICNAPIKIGGHDFDLVLNDILTEESGAIPPFGSQGDQMPGERGSYYAQFMTMQDIKAGKSIFSHGDYYEARKDVGVEFNVMREMTVPVFIQKERFAQKAKPVFEKLWNFVKSKLLLNCTNDKNKIDTLIFAGGGSDTYGLEAFIKRKLSEEFCTRKIKYIDFSPIDSAKGYEVAVCKPSYAAAIGAALFAVGKYKFKIVTTKAYGTAVNNETRCSIIIKKGEEIPLKGELIENDTMLCPFNIPAKYNKLTKRHEWADVFYKLDYEGTGTFDLNSYTRKQYNVVEQRATVIFEEAPSKTPRLVAGKGDYFYDLYKPNIYDPNERKNGMPCLEGFIIDCEGRGVLEARKRSVVRQPHKDDTAFAMSKLDVDFTLRNLSVHIPYDNMEMD